MPHPDLPAGVPAPDLLDALAREARALEPDADRRADWDAAVHALADRFLDGFGRRPAWGGSPVPGEDPPAAPGEEGAALDDLLAALERGWRRGLDPAHPGHLAYIPGGGLYPSALADFLADVSNRYAGVGYAGPDAVALENGLVRWLADLAGLPEGARGHLASGGSTATLSAVATARDALGLEPEDIRRAVVYLGGQTHHCVHKALRLAGLERAVWRNVPLDARWRMDAGALEGLMAEDVAAGLRPFLVVGSAGTTDTGAVDPLLELGRLARAHGAWFHVDAAYGGAFLLVPALRERLAGIEAADSLVIDPHKGLFLPYGTGALLVRDGEALYRTHRYSAAYLADALSGGGDPADLSPELTKHWRGLRLWLPLRLFGLRPFRAALAEKAGLCRWFHRAIGEAGFETGPEPDLSVCVYRFVPPDGRDPDAFNRALLDAVLADGGVFLSSTRLGGRLWLRLAVLSFRTHLDTVRRALERLVRERDRLLAAGA